MANPILEVENLCVDIEVPSGILHAVQNVSFSVAKGETLCIVGESGCGKSITALSLMNLLPKSAKRGADKLTLDGLDLRNLK
jgi:peptide/nickel transport system ATP-binding protein